MEEIVVHCEGVVEARRITLRRGETTIETNTIVLTFKSCRLPATVRGGSRGLEVKVLASHSKGPGFESG